MFRPAHRHAFPALRHAFFLAVFAVLSGFSLSLAHDEQKPSGPSLQGPSYRASDWGRGGGFVSGVTFASSNATLLARITNQEIGTTKTLDCWGYTSPSGREYAIWCHRDGTHFVDISDPTDPAIVAFVPGPSFLAWRDAKVYQDHAYVVSESQGGIQVVDLSAIDAGVVTHVTEDFGGPGGATHNVAINTESGFLYNCGGLSTFDGLRMYDLADPSNPVYVGSWDDRYVHDAQVVTFDSGPYAGREIAFCCTGFNGGGVDTGLSILDVTDKANPVHRGQMSWPNAAYSHQAWLSEDRQTLYLNDEKDEQAGLTSTIYSIDVSDIDNPTLIGSFTNGNNATGHNLYVKGERIYAANYTSGLRVFDTSVPGPPTEAAWFDTFPSSDSKSYSGMWSTYPFFESGVTVCTDTAGGLFLIWAEAPPVTFAFPGGPPTLVPPGDTTVTFNVGEAQPGALVPGSAKLFFDAGAGFVEAPLTDLGGGSFEATLSALPCGAGVPFYLTAESSTGLTWVDPPNGTPYTIAVSTATAFAFQDDFDTNLGWSIGAPDDDAVEGVWQRVDPRGSDAQSEDDFDPDGNGFCWVTMQGAVGGPAVLSDVDGGKTTLTSPAIDLSTPADYYVSFQRWYTNELGPFPNEDVFQVEVSSDGATWVPVDTVGPDGPSVGLGWRYFQFRVEDFVPLTSNVRVRFIASDYGGDSLVEAGIDDFAVHQGPCPDCNGDGQSDQIQLIAGALSNNDDDQVPDACEGLSVDTTLLSAGAGGTAAFELTGPAAEAGRLYLLLGSLTGTAPGFTVGAVQVPLNQDAYFNFTVTKAGSPPLVNGFGLLDANAEASASFVLAPGTTNVIGLQANHAWVAVDPFTFAVTYASHALPLDFEL